MNNLDLAIKKTARLVRVAAWGQLLGYTLFSLSLVIEDAPAFFSRVDPLELLWPIILLIAIHVLKLDVVVSRLVPRWFIVFGIMVLSLATLAASIMALSLAFGIPSAFATSGWQYLQISTTVMFIVFAVSFTLNLVLSVRAIQASDEAQSPNVA